MIEDVRLLGKPPHDGGSKSLRAERMGGGGMPSHNEQSVGELMRRDRIPIDSADELEYRLAGAGLRYPT